MTFVLLTVLIEKKKVLIKACLYWFYDPMTKEKI